MKTLLNVSSFIFLILFGYGCNSQTQPTSTFDYGTVENSQYSNNFFHFKIRIPSEWYIQTRDSLVFKVKDIYKDGKFTGNSKNIQTSIENSNPSKINKALLLSVFRYDLDSIVNLNYSMYLVAINLKNEPNSKTGKDCLNELVTASNRHQVKRKFIGEPKLLKIGNKDFYEITSEMEAGQIVDGIVKQKYCISVINGFSFSIIMTYSTDEQLAELNKILETATFTK